MLFGIRVLPRARQNLMEWRRLQARFGYYDITQVDAEAAADLQVALRRRGRQLATVDALIASLALRYNLTLLTIDKDFDAIQDMQRENWLTAM